MLKVLGDNIVQFLINQFLVTMQDIAGINLNFDIPKWIKILHLDRLNSYAGKFFIL